MRKRLLQTLLAGLFLLIGSSASALEMVDSVYQIGTATDLVEFAQKVSAGEQTANAVLTANIDLNGVEMPPIGTVTFPYKGIFDGQGFRVDNWNRVAAEAKDGLFGHLMDATVMNLTVDGTFDASDLATDGSGTIGFATGTTLIRNVHSDVDVTVNNNKHVGGLVGSLQGTAWIDRSSYSGTLTVNVSFGDSNGGVCGYSNTGKISNCLFSGRIISLNTEKSFHFGGILGYVNNDKFQGLNGCLSTGSVEAEVDCATFAAILGRANTNTPSEVLYGNCWLGGKAARGMAGAKAVHTECLTEEQLANGYATYMLNVTNDVPVWFQQIGTDPMPVREGSAVVYATGTVDCDGTFGENVTFSNTEGTLNYASHQLDEDGFCTVCGQLGKDEEGFFLISNAKALRWISAEVAAGKFKNIKTNLRITADLDLGGENWIPIGNDSQMFMGDVDGGFHTISNMKVDWDQPGAGLFGTVASGNIYNLIIDETCSVVGVKYAGGLIGHTSGAAVTNITQVGVLCDVTCQGEAAAGIVGNANASNVCNIYRCFTTGSISAAKDAACFSGWLGNVGAKVQDCWTVSEVTNFQNEGKYLARHGGSSPLKNCYSLYGTQAPNIDMDDLGSGKLAWLLNGKSFINPMWFQTIGADEYPIWDKTHGFVYEASEDSYASVTDEASYQTFVSTILDTEKSFAENTIATQSLLDDYVALVEILASAADRESFFVGYEALMLERDTVENSAALYAEYAKRCEDIIAFLDTTVFSGNYRSILEDYLYETLEPNETYPNGSYLHVYGSHVLTDEALKVELEFVEELLKQALAEDYQPGAEITSLLVNPLFDHEEPFHGWTYETSGTSFWTATVPCVLSAAEGYNCVFDINQTLTGLKNGIYMLEVNGAFRAGADIYNDYHAAMAYMNGNYNYVMMESEDVLLKDAAVDGENCLLTGDVKDYTYILGEKEGYVPYGPVGCTYAFKAGRYVNRVAAEVTDGTLTVGLMNPGSNTGKDWVGFGNFRLFYLGSEETANETLDRVLESYVARANTISNFIFSWAEDFSKYPNHSEALKAEMADAVAAVAAATDAKAKMELVAKFSEIFRNIYECRQAYVNMIQTASSVLNVVDEMLRYEYVTQEEYNAVYEQHEAAWNAYCEGTVSAEEALEIADKFNENELYPKFVDGAYQLATIKDVNIFALMVNVGQSYINGALVNDLDFTGVEDFTPIGWNLQDDGVTANNSFVYRGEFNGNGHTISNLNINKINSIGVGFFGSIGSPAKITDLRLDNTCVIVANDRAGLVGRSTGSGEIYLERLGNEGTVSASIAAAGILGNANDGSIANITDCYSTGIINQPEGATEAKNCVQICGWMGSVGGSITNCWSIASVTGFDNASRMFCRAANEKTIITNSYSIIGDGTTAMIVTKDAVANGELTYKLNEGNVEEPIWRQTLGEGGDAHPVLNPAHLIVYQLEDGTYTNDPDGTDAITEIKAELGSVVSVYDAQGRILRSNVSAEGSLNGMPKGFYILKGQNGTGRSIIKK